MIILNNKHSRNPALFTESHKTGLWPENDLHKKSEEQNNLKKHNIYISRKNMYKTNSTFTYEYVLRKP